jgi:hypothetical protein
VSHIRGRFSVDVQFTDATAEASVQSLKTIAITHATEYDFGKVALATGTVGTAVIQVAIAPTTYRNAAGDIVSFSSVSRVAFQASGPTLVACDGIGGCGEDDWTIYSRAGQVAVSEALETVAFSINVFGTAGTSAYTLVMYGS